MKVIRLLFLVLLFQQAVFSSFASNSTIPFLKACSSEVPSHYSTNKSSLFETNTLSLRGQQWVDRELPDGLADTEDNIPSEAGLQIAVKYDWIVQGRGILCPLPQQWYNFFRQLTIPPPKLA